MTHKMADCAHCDGPIYDTDDATGISLAGPMHMECYTEKYDEADVEIRRQDNG